MPFDAHAVAALRERVVGRERETELLVAALASGAHVLLEGPPGTGKSTLLRSVASAAAVPFCFAEGNAELTPARLAGHFDPAQVMTEGYAPQIFIDGPLVEALRNGSLLYVEEINRIPEETLNLLISVMSEGELHVPRLGVIAGAAGFRLVAAMNPFDTVGTARISSAIYDRVSRIAMPYQDEAAEAEIAAREASDSSPDPEWIGRAVTLVRRTRDHAEIRVGSSVRGTIDFLRLARALSELRRTPATDWQVGLDAALVALSGRIQPLDAITRPTDAIVRELYEEIFGPEPQADEHTSDSGADPDAAQRQQPPEPMPGKAEPRHKTGGP